MSFPQVYFYNENRHPVTVLGQDNEHYFLPARNFTYLRVSIHADSQIPSGVTRYDTPAGWDETMWPWTKPWDVQ